MRGDKPNAEVSATEPTSKEPRSIADDETSASTLETFIHHQKLVRREERASSSEANKTKILYRREAPAYADHADRLAILGNTIMRYRRRFGLTQAQLAQLVGTSSQRVSRWERGSGEVSAIELLTLCEIFDYPPETLLMAASPHVYALAKRLDAQEGRLLQAFRMLPIDQRETMIALLAGSGRLEAVEPINKEEPM